ncbi:MAG TPA: hypothetical protein VH352_16055 [Pseudonocardiaceae bacterium]|jgi:hypothetical protein|nr:hypothetical protein [Pseudonocardiaceae bacterium]
MAASEQPEPSGPELLAKAMESLTSTERQRITAWFMTNRLSGVEWGPGPAADVGLGRRHDVWQHVMGPSPDVYRDLYERRFGGSSVFGRGQQVVPVRLPTELHARLRSWCADNGFSMATVVRGLVSRFLDGQTPVDGPESPPEPAN